MCVYGSGDGDLARYVAVVTGDMAGQSTGVTHGEQAVDSGVSRPQYDTSMKMTTN